MNIPFNKPYIVGTEINNISRVIDFKKLAGDGKFTFSVQNFFEKKYFFKKTLLTTSCTDALELAALLLELDSKSEVIIPSYTFVSTANAFALRGAKIVFADSEANTPNIDVEKLEPLINRNTKAIVVVHYAGVACNMTKLLELSNKYNIKIIEDAAQAIDSYFNNIPLGSIGSMGAFSFHETKNIIAGEGGLLTVNDVNYFKRAEIIREKGTNRSQFFRGEVNKYGWVELGSSFLASELIAAFLSAQLESLETIQRTRISHWNRFYNNLQSLKNLSPNLLPFIPEYATNNGHMFYIKCRSLDERSKLISHLSSKGIKSTFHYLSLHSSQYYAEKHDGRILVEADNWTNCLIRLPLFFELLESEIDYISNEVLDFFNA